MSDATYDALVEVIAQRATTAPFLVGFAGAVAVGKTTIVRAVARGLEARGRRVDVLSTDAFLLSNAVLNERGLLMRKGFPESYDDAAIGDVLRRLRSGAAASVRVYSHDVYDVLPDVTATVGPADVVLVEGVVALQSPVADLVDLAVYVDAPEACVRQWFVERFARLTDDGAHDPTSFYHRLAAMPREQVRQLAEATWEGVNGPNLHAHIAPSAARADIVVVKAPDHSIAELRLTPPA
jgi:type I pantothenate kinase